jgi:hypothetical protein
MVVAVGFHTTYALVDVMDGESKLVVQGRG